MPKNAIMLNKRNEQVRLRELEDKEPNTEEAQEGHCALGRGSNCQSYIVQSAKGMARRSSQRQQRQCTRGKCQKGRQSRKKQEEGRIRSCGNRRAQPWAFGVNFCFF